MSQSKLRFSIEESVWLKKGQEVAEVLSMSLDPEISITEEANQVCIKGALLLCGKYRTEEGDENNSNSGENPLSDGASYRSLTQLNVSDDGVTELVHRFPVDITIPSYRVEDFSQVKVEVESFEYELPNSTCIELSASICIYGIKDEKQRQESQFNEMTNDAVEAEMRSVQSGEKSDIFTPFQFEARQTNVNSPQENELKSSFEKEILEARSEKKTAYEFKPQYEAVDDRTMEATFDTLKSIAFSNEDTRNADSDDQEEDHQDYADDHVQEQPDYSEDVSQDQYASYEQPNHQQDYQYQNPFNYQSNGYNEQNGHSEQHVQAPEYNQGYNQQAQAPEYNQDYNQQALAPEYNQDYNQQAQAPKYNQGYNQQAQQAPKYNQGYNQQANQYSYHPQDYVQRPYEQQYGEQDYQDEPEYEEHSYQHEENDNQYYAHEEETEQLDDVQEDREEEQKNENALYLTKMLSGKEDNFSKMKMYILQRGDSLEHICERYDISLNTLMRMNKIQKEELSEGQIIYIPVSSR